MEEEVQEQKMGKISFEQFLKRVKNKQNVSKFEFEIDFRWNLELSKKLKEIGLSKANLSGADLRGADLIEADLIEADLSYSNLSGADLRWADLRWADLSYSNLSGADLRGADLRGADLSGAKGEFIFNFGVKLKVMNEKIVVEV